MQASILLAIVIASAVVVPGQTVRCPALYHAVGNGCYLFPTQEYSWFNASHFCYFSGGYLAKINNVTEETDLRVYMSTVDDSNCVSRWIGACDSLTEGTYRWVPSGETLEYQNWHTAGYPSSQPEKDCVYWFHPSNYWINEYCDEYFGIAPLCEADPLT